MCSNHVPWNNHPNSVGLDVGACHQKVVAQVWVAPNNEGEMTLTDPRAHDSRERQRGRLFGVTKDPPAPVATPATGPTEVR